MHQGQMRRARGAGLVIAHSGPTFRRREGERERRRFAAYATTARLGQAATARLCFARDEAHDRLPGRARQGDALGLEEEAGGVAAVALAKFGLVVEPGDSAQRVRRKGRRHTLL